MGIFKSKIFWVIVALVVAIYFFSKKKKIETSSNFDGIPEKRYPKHEVSVNKELAR